MIHLFFFLLIFCLKIIEKSTDGSTLVSVKSILGNGGTTFSSSAAASSAGLTPLGIWRSISGDFYICDSANNRVRLLSTNGIVTNFAGSSSTTFSGDSSTATSAGLNPYHALGNSNDRVYISDTVNNRIRLVSTASIISTFAGTGSTGYTNSKATSSAFNKPRGIWLYNGYLYISDYDSCAVRKIELLTSDTSDAIGRTGVCGTSSVAAASIDLVRIGRPSAVWADIYTGKIYVADTTNNQVQVFEPSANLGTVRIFSSGFNGPLGVSGDRFGNISLIYVADTGNNRIKELDSSGVASVLVGDGTTAFAGNLVAGTSTGIGEPQFVYVDDQTTSIVCYSDKNNNRLIQTYYSGKIALH